MTVKHEARVLELELRTVKELCRSINSPRSLTIWLLLEHREFDQLVSLPIDPRNYVDTQSFADDYLVTSVLQKNARLPTSFDRKAVAMEKFWAAENVCAQSNDRIGSYMNGDLRLPDDVECCLNTAQRIISRILGPLTRNRLTRIEEQMRFGPGATTSLSGVVTQGKKYSARTLDATPRALHYRMFCFPEAWKANASQISVRTSSKIRTVPKNAKTDRTICIEPDLNIFIQLGIGAEIKNRLASFGLDLRSQDWNRELASIAHEFDLCTMDLSSASDMIASQTVWLLFPPDWADLLYFARTDFVESETGLHELHKWSSMGNGYTFELESLLFYAVILAACENAGESTALTSVFGDDLIFPNSVRDVVQRTLNFLGFKVNVEKTFGKGIFHESCGTDWFRGTNVRPFFFRTDHHDFPTVCYILANAITSWAHRNLLGCARDARLLPAWLRCYTACPASARHRIPLGYGDVGFASSFDEARPSLVQPRNGRSRQRCAGIIHRFPYRRIGGYTKVIDQHGACLSALNCSSMEWSLGRETLRGRFVSAVTRHGLSLDWPYVGPWL